MAALGLCCCAGFSPAAVCRQPWQVGFGSCCSWALGHRLSSCDTHRLSSSMACEIFPDQSAKLCLLYCQVDSSPLSHQRNQDFCEFSVVEHLNLVSSFTDCWTWLCWVVLTSVGTGCTYFSFSQILLSLVF